MPFTSYAVVMMMIQPTLIVASERADDLGMLTAWLEGEGYSVTGTQRIGDVPGLAFDQLPGLIVLDVSADCRDGGQVLQLLEANPATISIPILFVLPEQDAPSWAEDRLHDVTGYVTRPLSLSELSGQIRAALAGRPRSVVPERLIQQFTEFVQVALKVDLTWLLVADTRNQVLEDRALACTVESPALPPQLPFVSVNTAFKGVLRRRTPVLGVPLEAMSRQAAMRPLHDSLMASGIRYIDLLPLWSRQQVIGLLVLGSMEAPPAGAGRQGLIESAVRQAVVVLDYIQLADNLVEQEAMMEAEQAFLHMILDTMGDGLVVVGEQGGIEYVNTRLLLMTGYTRQEIFGQGVGILFHPDDRDALVRSLLKGAGSTMKLDQRLLKKSGEALPVLLSRSSFAALDPDAPQQVLVLSDLTEQKSREEALQRQSQQLEALNHAVKVISSSLSPSDVINQILDVAVRMVEAQGASILLRAEDNPDELAFVATVGPQADTILGLRVPLGQGVAGWVAREATSQLVADTGKDSRFYRNIDASSGLTTQTLIAVPLIVSDRVIGVLEVINKQHGAFNRLDVELLENIAGTAAVALENARLYDQTRRRLKDVGTLLDSSAAVSSTLDFGSVLELIARRLVDALEVERCLIAGWDRSSNGLGVLAEVAGAYWGPDSGPVRDLTELPLHHAALVSGRVVSAHVSDPTCSPEERRTLQEAGQRAMLGVPLWIGGRVVGMLSLFSHVAQQFYSDVDSDRVDRVVRAWQAQLGHRIESTWRNREALATLSEQIQEAASCTWVAVEEWLPGHSQIRRLFETGFSLWPDQRGVRYSLREFPAMMRALSVGQPKVVCGTEQEIAPREQEFLARLGGQVLLMAPLMIRGNPEGLVLLVDSDRTRTFDAEQISLCQGIANVVGNAMENANLYQSLERRARALEAAYDELKQADQLKDDLLQNLSHEIQTPLLHILGYIELMHSEAFGPLNAEQREKLDFVIQRARHLSELVKDIIAVQALHAHPLDRRACQMEDIVERAVRTWVPAASRRSIEIVRQVPPGLPSIAVDERLLAEAVEHLLENAIKFSPDRTRVEIAVFDRGGELEVRVKDQGIGIPKEAHTRIFQRFYQIDSSATRRYGGTGLGLAIVQETIQQHGGRIWVESEVGRGSTFIFALPKTAEAGARASQPTIKRLKPS